MTRILPSGLVQASCVLPAKFGDERRNVADFPANAQVIAVSGRRRDETRGWELLSEFKQVESLFGFQLAERHLDWIAQMPSLRRLGLLQTKTGDLSALSQLKTLEVLVLEDANKLESLAFLRELPQLKAFSVMDAKRLNDLSGLESQMSLEELALQSGMWNVLKVQTLAPLARLEALRWLYMTAEAQAESLEPLKGLSRLEGLSLNLLYPLDQYAKLSVFLPAKLSSYFSEPYETMMGLCRRDGAHTTILAAKGIKRFCRDCQPERFDEYMAEFQRVREETKRQGKW